MDYEKLVGELMRRLELTTDKDLAHVLGVVPSQITNWRKGRSELGPITKLVILDKLGYAWARDALFAILPKPRKVSLTTKDNQRAVRAKTRAQSQFTALHADDKTKAQDGRPDPVQGPVLETKRRPVRKG